MSEPITQPAVFLDRDGTINLEKAYLHRTEDLELIPGAAAAIRRLNDAGYLVIVVTNQSGVARGFYGESDVRALHHHLRAVLDTDGARLDLIYFCPYHRDGAVAAFRRDSHLRKPRIGMFERAVEDLEARGVTLDTERSFMIGDKLADVKFGIDAGLRSILVETGYGAQTRPMLGDLPVAVVPSIVEAVDLVLS
jgi:D-glycero-D-manno-heptose 1,7-bisphosphate phosphatase